MPKMTSLPEIALFIIPPLDPPKAEGPAAGSHASPTLSLAYQLTQPMAQFALLALFFLPVFPHCTP